MPSGVLDPATAVAAGFAVVIQDVRGTGTSGGAFEPYVHEADDGFDTIEWLAAQPWCDGRVVMTGMSYVGVVQWLAASRRPPALMALTPTITTDSLGEGWSFRGGVLEAGFLRTWIANSLAPPDLRVLDGLDAVAEGGGDLSVDRALVGAVVRRAGRFRRTGRRSGPRRARSPTSSRRSSSPAGTTASSAAACARSPAPRLSRPPDRGPLGTRADAHAPDRRARARLVRVGRGLRPARARARASTGRCWMGRSRPVRACSPTSCGPAAGSSSNRGRPPERGP